MPRGPIKLSPTQLDVLRNLSGPARIGVVLKLSVRDVGRLRKAVVQFIEASHLTLKGQWHALLLTPEGTPGTEPVDVKAIAGHVSAGRKLIWVDKNLRIVKAQVGNATITEVSKVTLRKHTLGFVITGDRYWEILEGQSRDERSVVGRITPVPFKTYARPAAELNDLLTDHFHHCVAREQGVQYWHDKSKRILSTGVDGTETIFQHSLLTWLRENVLDQVDVYAELAQQFGQDRTDVVVVATAGRYVIEVKWLGKNKNNTSWGEGRINEGLVQVRIYITNSPCIQGFLAVYDARPEHEHKRNSRYKKTLMHSLCAPPRIFFLDSSNPSQVAAVEAKS